MGKITKKELDAFIVEEAPHHPEGYLTKEKALQFIRQRRYAAEQGRLNIEAQKKLEALNQIYREERAKQRAIIDSKTNSVERTRYLETYSHNKQSGFSFDSSSLVLVFIVGFVIGSTF